MKRFMFFSALAIALLFNAAQAYAQRSAIPVNELTLLIDFQKTSRPSFEELMKCKVSKDTLRTNLPYSYSDAIAALGKHFRKIDSLPISIAARKYAKALICADFVYAAFSYRLLGDQPGMVNDSVAANIFNQLSLAQRYALGNHNHNAVYCNERAKFYRTLIDSLLQLKSYTAHVNGVHSFPLVIIEGRTYIIDPYDPFVVVNTKKGRLLPYSQILHVAANNVAIYRTNRTFGNTRELISVPLLKKYASNTLPCSITQHLRLLAKNYQQQHSAESLNKVHIPDMRNILPLATNSRFNFAIPLATRPDGKLETVADLNRFYFSPNNE